MTPFIPQDLEREIFEFLALSNPRYIPKLVLVARRVQSWVEPLLYRNLSVIRDKRADSHAVDLVRISTSNCLAILPASFLHVRHLALTGVPANAVPLILAQCSGVVCLAIFQTPPDPAWLPLIAVMSNLRQLSADINPLFIRDRVDFNHSIFAGITHLDMFETPLSENWVTDICSLPSLTHLSFNFDSSGPSVDLVHVHHIIANSKSLEVLVLIFADDVHQAEFDDLYQCFGDDPRSVVMSVPDFVGDWERGATGGDDYWIQAERFIQKRRSGEIKGSEYVVPLRST